MTIRHRTVETNGIRMHVAEAGAGFPVLFCHGAFRHSVGTNGPEFP